MILMIFLFPLISFGLCAWMAVFGFYLRLEEAAWARYLVRLATLTDNLSLLSRIKRKRKKEKIENILKGDWIKSHSKEDLTEVTTIFSIISPRARIPLQSMYDLCSASLQQGQGQLPQQKSLEEILKQELTWTLEQVGHSNTYGVNSNKYLDWRGRGAGAGGCK